MATDGLDAIEALSIGPLGDGISPREIASFLLSGWARQRPYRRGEAIFSVGDVPDRLFILVSGRVLLRQETAAGTRLSALEIGAPGSCFGEAALFRAPLPYDFSAETLAETVLVEIARGLFSGTSATGFIPTIIPAAATAGLGLSVGAAGRAAALITRNLLRLMAARAARLERRVRVLSGETLRQKIARYLLVPPVPESVRAEELASHLAVAPSKLKAEIEAMAEQGSLALNGRLIKIGDSAALGAFV